MTRITTFALSLLLVAAANPSFAKSSRADGGEQQLAALVAGRVSGKPVNCVFLQDIRSSRVLGRTALVYRARGGRLYVNRPKAGAETLRSDDILVTKIWGSQLCSSDIVRLLDPTSRFEHGFVGLGEFVPYDRPRTGARRD